MKTKTLLLLLGICMSNSIAFAQKKEFKFGKINPDEFQVKASGQDSAAAAIKLFDVGNCYFEYGTNGFVYIFQRHFRIKILNKNGYDLANYKIGLYKASGGAKEELYGMEAASYNMVDGKMVTSKLNKDAKFTEEFNKQYTYKKFALPNVKEGTIIEFKFTIKSDFIFNLRGWNFQSDIPIAYTEYNVTIPEYFRYKPNVNGILKVTQTKREDVNATFNEVSGTAVYTQYVMENVPALKDEAYITTLDDYRPSIEFELMATQFPNAMYKDYTGTWPKIVKSLVDDENFGLFINKNSYAKTVLPGILKGEKDTLAMVKLIYNYVKENIKWNDDHSYYASSTNPKTAFEKKIGNAADINLSLVSLLRESKIDARPLLVSTRDNGAHPGTPIISKFNNVIAHVSIGGKDVLLDATDKDLPLGMVSFDNLNHQALLIDIKDIQSRWIMTEPQFSGERTYNYNLVLDKENKLKGSLSQYAKGYSALNTRDKYRTKNNEAEYIKDLKKDKTGLGIANYKMGNLNELDEVLMESMDVEIEDNVEEAGNLVYFTPLLFERTKENMFKHDKRSFPVDFGYPIKENYRITVNFPEDYEIDKLPTGGSYKIPNNKGTFTITFLSQGKTVMVKSTIDIPKTVYSPDEYFDLKELFKAIVAKQAEQIVFKKKAE
jgi:transglutaminase-like putative cysteine protease